MTTANLPQELNLKKWKQVRLRLLATGEFDPNLLDEMSPEQRYWVNQTKNAYRDFQRMEHEDIDTLS